jgi:hypothetical protein
MLPPGLFNPNMKQFFWDDPEPEKVEIPFNCSYIDQLYESHFLNVPPEVVDQIKQLLKEINRTKEYLTRMQTKFNRMSLILKIIIDVLLYLEDAKMPCSNEETS